MLFLFGQFVQTGLLPCGGGLMDQSAVYFAAMAHLSSVHGRHMKALEDKQQAEAKRGRSKKK